MHERLLGLVLTNPSFRERGFELFLLLPGGLLHLLHALQVPATSLVGERLDALLALLLVPLEALLLVDAPLHLLLLAPLGALLVDALPPRSGLELLEFPLLCKLPNEGLAVLLAFQGDVGGPLV